MGVYLYWVLSARFRGIRVYRVPTRSDLLRVWRELRLEINLIFIHVKATGNSFLFCTCIFTPPPAQASVRVTLLDISSSISSFYLFKKYTCVLLFPKLQNEAKSCCISSQALAVCLGNISVSPSVVVTERLFIFFLPLVGGGAPPGALLFGRSRTMLCTRFM